jgi:hypothetical protein
MDTYNNHKKSSPSIVKSALSLMVVLLVSMNVTNVFSQVWVNTNGPNRKYPSLGLAVGKSGSTQKIWVANDGEQLRYSSNAGTSWNTANFLGAPVQVACQKNNPNIVLGVRWLAYIHRTVNGGSTWPDDVTPQFAPNGNVVQTLEISSGDTSLAFIGYEKVSDGSAANFFRSTNNGSSFEPNYYFRDEARTYINAILPYPQSGSYQNYVWVGGSQDDIVEPPKTDDEESVTIKSKGIWRSTDGGLYWQRQSIYGSGLSSSNSNISALALSIKAASTHLLAAVKGGTAAIIYYSSDFGTTWDTSSNDIGSGIEIVNALKVHPVKPETLVAATDEGFAISTNRGSNWSLRNDANWSDKDARYVVFDLNDASGNTVYLATFTSVYKSTNLGTTWTDIYSASAVLPTASVSPRNTEYQAVFNGYSGISKFSGSSWNYPTFVGIKQVNGEPRRNFSGEYVAIHPRFSGFAYAVGDSGNDGGAKDAVLYYRTTSGGNWMKHPDLPMSSSYRFYNVVPDPKVGSARVYVCGSNSTYNYFASKDTGRSFPISALYREAIGGDASVPVLSLAIDTSVAIYEDESNHSKTLYAGLGGTGGLYKSTDGGGSWSQKISNRLIRAVAVNGKNTTTALTVYAGGDSLWKSTDGFAHKSNVSIPFTGVKRLLMHPSYTDVNHLWAVSANGNQLFKTINGGSSWTTVSTTGVSKPINDLRSDPTNSDIIFIATDSGVYRTDPPPEAPTNVTRILPESVHPKFYWDANPETDFKEYQVYKQLSGTPFRIATQTSTTFEDFDEYNDGEQEAIYFVKAVDSANNVSAASDAILFHIAGGRQAKIRSANLRELPKEFSLSQNYPNPFNPVTAITSALPVDATVTLKIFDAGGKEVATLVKGFREAGYDEASFDAKKLASGVYFYRLDAVPTNGGEPFTKTNKMVLMK